MSAALHEDLLRAIPSGTAFDIRISGRCMSPFVRDGDIVVVRRAASVAPGAIAAVVSPSGPRAHRVLATSSSEVRLCGDWSRVPDPVAAPGDVLGPIIAIRRGDRLVSLDTRPLRLYGRLMAAFGRAPRSLRTPIVIPMSVAFRVLDRLLKPSSAAPT